MRELMAGARKAVNVCMGVKRHEKLLILIDTFYENIGKSLFQAGIERGVETILVTMTPRKQHGEEPPEIVAEIMKHADVIIAPTMYSLTHTEARRNANRAGARIATMPGVTEEMFVTGGMTADFEKIEKTNKRLYRVVCNGKTATVKTKKGTNLKMSIEGREWIIEDTGICHRKGMYTNLPAGEIFIAPVEGTAEGRLVIDGVFGVIIKEPVYIDVKHGIAEKIENADKIVKLMDKKGKEARYVSELGMGTNPEAKIIGNVLEDEKSLGTVHIGFGDNSTFGGKISCGIHIDGIIKNSTLYIDDKKILDEGKLVI